MSAFLPVLLTDVIRPVHDGLMAEFGIPSTIDADCLSLAIKIQESGDGPVRDQGDPNITGPATGLWQFERGGGVWEVLNLAKIAPIFKTLCGRAGIRAEADAVWRFFTTPQSDELAAAAARLVIYLDPAPIPPATLASAAAASAYYHRRWRPGAKRDHDFITKSWPRAVALVQQYPRGATPTPAPAGPVPALPVSPDALADIERRLRALEQWRDWRGE